MALSGTSTEPNIRNSSTKVLSGDDPQRPRETGGDGVLGVGELRAPAPDEHLVAGSVQGPDLGHQPLALRGDGLDVGDHVEPHRVVGPLAGQRVVGGQHHRAVDVAARSARRPGETAASDDTSVGVGVERTVAAGAPRPPPGTRRPPRSRSRSRSRSVATRAGASRGQHPLVGDAEGHRQEGQPEQHQEGDHDHRDSHRMALGEHRGAVPEARSWERRPTVAIAVAGPAELEQVDPAAEPGQGGRQREQAVPSMATTVTPMPA